MRYPAHWDADVVLADGGTARLRPIAPGDREAYLDFYARVSDASKFLRFMQPHPRLSDDEVDRFTRVDHYDHVALVVELRDELIAVARYVVVPGADAERVATVAFLVRDDHQGRGIAHLLLEHLAACGRERGVTRFVAEVLPENRRMLRVFTGAGWSVSAERADDLVQVDLDLTPTDRTRTEARRRHLRSQGAAIHRLLHPTGVAVVGRADQLGRWVEQVSASFRGPVELAMAGDGDDRTPAALLAAGEGPVDLVVTRASFDELDDLLRVAARRRAHAVVVLAGAGTQPFDPDEAGQLVAWARGHDLRVLGPESLGLLTTDPAAPLNVTPGPMPRRGGVAMFAQSAGVSTIMLSRALATGLGVSSLLSAGRFGDISGNDALRHWGADPSTRVVLAALDTIGNPRTFHRVLRRVAAAKTVVLFAPARALPDVPAQAVAQVMRQAGAVVVSRRQTMVDVAHLAARQPVPRGTRVAVLSNTARLADQLGHAARRFGLQPAEPVVVAGPSAPEQLAAAARGAATSGDVDAVVAAMVEVASASLEDAHAALAEVAASGTGVPVVGVFVGLRRVEPVTDGDDLPGGLPAFDSYGDALEALALLAHAQPHRAELPQAAPVDAHAVDRVVAAVLADDPRGRALAPAEADALAASLGLARDDAGGGVRVVLRGVEDPALGPVVSAGVAGVPVEVFDDLAWRVPPLDVAGAHAMLDSLRARPLLDAAPGRDALATAIARLAALKDAFGEVVELTLELTVDAAGARVCGASGRVAPLPRERHDLARRVD